MGDTLERLARMAGRAPFDREHRVGWYAAFLTNVPTAFGINQRTRSEYGAFLHLNGCARAPVAAGKVMHAAIDCQ